MMATYTGTRKSNSRRQLVVVSLVALAIGMAAGVGAWQVGLNHRGSTATQVQPQGGSQASSLPATGSSAAEQPANVTETGGYSAPATSSVPTAASPHYLYLVSSAAQAHDVQQGLDRVQAALAGQPLDATVLVVPPEVSAGQVAESVDEVLGLEGLAPVTVEDLRTPDAGMPPITNDTAAVPGAVSSTTTELASPPATSGATIAQARQAIADENRLRVSLGLKELELPPVDQAARQAIADENRLRASLGLPELPGAQ
jgi:hypothetical protein